MKRRTSRSTLFPYTTLFRSGDAPPDGSGRGAAGSVHRGRAARCLRNGAEQGEVHHGRGRSEEHTSELQSRGHLVCRLLLEKKNKQHTQKEHDKVNNSNIITL